MCFSLFGLYDEHFSVVQRGAGFSGEGTTTGCSVPERGVRDGSMTCSIFGLVEGRLRMAIVRYEYWRYRARAFCTTDTS